ncbi:MAG: Holliday junction branch migration protein RuvA [Planctomycetes bacterium]|nr:Holliday junction branch migration protein RuvA [Planctomycetota bacterium]
MYDHLLGEIIDKHASRVVIRCGGVGYDCRVSLSTSAQLAQGQTHQLFTILHVVDGNPSLLAFATPTERELARRVLSVSGVGPAIALALLSVYAPGELAATIAAGDAAALKRVKGVGTKTAERICLELRDAMHKLDLGVTPGEPPTALPSQSADDAVAALVTLGYSEKDARAKVDRARRSTVPDASTEILVKAVLQM